MNWPIFKCDLKNLTTSAHVSWCGVWVSVCGSVGSLEISRKRRQPHMHHMVSIKPKLHSLKPACGFEHVGLSMWVWACGSGHVGLSMWVQPSMGNNDVYIYVHPWEGYGGALRHVLYCAWDHRQHLVLLATMVISRTCYPTFLLFCHRLLWAMPLKNIRKQALMWTHCWWPGLAT